MAQTIKEFSVWVSSWLLSYVALIIMFLIHYYCSRVKSNQLLKSVPTLIFALKIDSTGSFNELNPNETFELKMDC